VAKKLSYAALLIFPAKQQIPRLNSKFYRPGKTMVPSYKCDHLGQPGLC